MSTKIDQRYEHGVQFALTDTTEPVMRTRELIAEASRRASNNGHHLYDRWHLTIDHRDNSIIGWNDCRDCHMSANVDNCSQFSTITVMIFGRATEEGCPGDYDLVPPSSSDGSRS